MPAHTHGATCWVHHPTYDRNERSFACSVGAKKGEYFALFNVQGYRLQGLVPAVKDLIYIAY